MEWAVKPLRIGGASAFWGDSAVGAIQLVYRGKVDVLVFDYLAELTMSILSAARARDPAAGWATDFVTAAMKPTLKQIAAQNIRVLSNAGGLNPSACAAALEKLAAEQGLHLKIAVVEGDDLMPRLDDIRTADLRDLASGRVLPEAVVSANAYLGAGAVRAALDAGAQIVITGRCVDSALALGALMHHFGWRDDEHDKLAAGSLCGHILECGAQATGGLYTDWADVPDWEDIGYPIAVCEADGAFTITKSEGTGGVLKAAALKEQLLYEIGDPRAYFLPDVVCDFTAVEIVDTARGPCVTGARGRPATPFYKATITYEDGWKIAAQLTIIGIDAVAKAERTAQAILGRTRRMFRVLNIGDYSETRVECLGAESAYGAHSRARDAREVVLRIAARHQDKKALDIFGREIAQAGTSFSPGTTGAGLGRPTPQKLVRLFSCLTPKAWNAPTAQLAQAKYDVAVREGAPFEALPAMPPGPPLAGATRRIRLIEIAHARSGDKGDSVNIGVIARRAEDFELLRQALTIGVVADYFSYCVEGPVERFDLPGISAVNFLLHNALGGGGMASLRNDPLGKGFAQMLLDCEIDVPADWRAA
jgi:hypothetical protein